MKRTLSVRVAPYTLFKSMAFEHDKFIIQFRWEFEYPLLNWFISWRTIMEAYNGPHGATLDQPVIYRDYTQALTAANNFKTSPISLVFHQEVEIKKMKEYDKLNRKQKFDDHHNKPTYV